LRQGDDVAFVQGNQALTHQELWQRSRKAAAILLTQGVRPRQNVLLIMDDDLAWPVLFHALILLGAVPVVTMPNADAAYLEHISSRLEIHHALGDADLVTSPHINTVSRVSAADIDTLQGEMLPLNRIYEYHDLDAWIILTSSGTTGSPKLIVHRHRGLEETFTRYNTFEFTTEHVVMCAVKMASSFGIIMTVLGAPAQGMKMVILDSPRDYRDLTAVMQAHAVTHAMLTPRMIGFLLNHDTPNLPDTLQYVYSTGESLPLPMAQEFQTRFGTTVYDSYGCGEVRGWALLINHKNNWRRGSLGLPAAPTICRIVNDQGHDCSEGEIGELWVHHSNLAMAYVGDAELSAARFQDSWYHTGDYVSRDYQGYLFYAGRREQLVPMQHGFFSCLDLENRVNQLPGVTDCVVLNSDDHGLEAFVMIHSAEAWTNVMRSGLSDQLTWHWVTELPVTGTNKKLRQRQELMHYVVKP
jgi:long-chain acyl-CoA synthetase